ncbi:MAG: precorrin-6y C5,15-methyltransferase (decarboxylating) subunit CbiE [Clostridium sp.]
MIYVVGIGPGHRDYILGKAIKTLENVDKIIGFSRAIDAVDFINNKKEKIESLLEIIKRVEEFNGNIAVVASGDPTFFGVSSYINKKTTKEVKVIPGLSSFQYMTSSLNKPWSFAYTGSMHAREDSFIEKIKENELSIWLCDKKNTPNKLCESLLDIDCIIYIGENLSYENEKLVFGKPKDFIEEEFSDMSILMVEIIKKK